MSDSHANAAVFLSYASQDTEAARSICNALVAAGVDVWFDQSELRGGDAWDQKIRRQIKDCALFLPLISANTQERTEGYFRLEWRLADQRTHLMGRSRPFIIPICVDATIEANADVPDSFLAVQWTRLMAGETPSTFCNRIKKLLASEDSPQTIREAAPKAPDAALFSPKLGSREPSLLDRKRLRVNLLVGLSVAVCAAIVATAIIIREKTTGNAGAAAQQPGSLAVPGPNAAESDQLATQARAIFQHIDYTRAGLALAEDLAHKATDESPASAKSWSAYALVNATFLQRGWDISADRHQATRIAANRTLALDPKNPDAIFALAMNVLTTDPAEAESIARHAIAASPDDPRFYRLIAESYDVRDQPQRRFELLTEAVRRFPSDALVFYDLGRAYRDYDPPNFQKALESFERCVKLSGAMSSAQVEIARTLMMEGDFAGADAALSLIPPDYASDDRIVEDLMRLGLVEHQPDRTIMAAAASSMEYFNDFAFHGPTSWFVALAYRLKGDAASEAHQWRIAESVIRRRIAADPLNPDNHAALAVSLIWLGRGDEAAQEMAAVEPLVRTKRFVAYYYAGLGDPEQTVKALRRSNGVISYQELERDPWWDKVRSAPVFAEFMAEVRTHGAESEADRKPGGVPATN